MGKGTIGANPNDFGVQITERLSPVSEPDPLACSERVSIACKIEEIESQYDLLVNQEVTQRDLSFQGTR